MTLACMALFIIVTISVGAIFKVLQIIIVRFTLSVAPLIPAYCVRKEI
jgi:hypothetical protein